MRIWHHLKRPPWRTMLLLLAVLGALGIGYLVWSPGVAVDDGRHDLRTNGIWIQHGWLGDDAWFRRNRRDKGLFRDDAKIRALAALFADHGIKYVFPHVCPCEPDGTIAPVDSAQTERFLDEFNSFVVIPWVGGVLDVHCSPESASWRASFVASVVDLLQRHPRLGGVHLNIEPMPSGNPHFLLILDELRQALPSGKILSVAAYPPPTLWHPFPSVHWEESYFREAARRVDQMAPMMYDTSIRLPKVYRHVMSCWTKEVLDWSGDTQVLLGIPAYDDADSGYHIPGVENLQHSLAGVHAGLRKYKTLPKHYAGVALYSEWETDPHEWEDFRAQFGKAPRERPK